MGKQLVLNEEEICREYNKNHVGIEAIAAKYHVGKLRIKDILKNNGIEVKDRGGQKQDN